MEVFGLNYDKRAFKLYNFSHKYAMEAFKVLPKYMDTY